MGSVTAVRWGQSSSGKSHLASCGDDGSVLRKYIGCVYTSGDHSLDANQVIRGTAQFMCRDVQGGGL